MKQRSARSTTLNETDLLDANTDEVGRLEGILRGVARAIESHPYLFFFIRDSFDIQQTRNDVDTERVDDDITTYIRGYPLRLDKFLSQVSIKRE
jgi:hypothetical protein